MPLAYYLLIAGVALLCAELAVPGFGIFGIASLFCFSGGAYFILGGGTPALMLLGGFYLLAALVVAFLCVYLPRESKWNPFVLWTKQKNSEGYTGGENLSALLGKSGTTLTTLRPAGTVLVEGRRYDACSLGDYVPKEERISIVKVEGSKIFVDLLRE